MATGQSHGFLRQLDGLLAEGTAAGLTDGQLLERFSARGGPAAELAFAAIVERHGPMVLRVCRGVLGRSREADAEDAFQATFLVLVKRARSLWVADSLGPWLHQVALRTASCARGAASRRHRHEAAGARPAEATVIHADDEDRVELGRILHEEIGRLPDRYRIPVVLCDLEGQTHEQAARHAGWPVGTVKSRLTRARERLRGRLAHRGVSPTIALIPMFRLELDAQVPDALVRSTTAAALRLAASHTLAGTTAGLLAQGVLTTMARSSWWKAGTVLLAAAATVSGARLVSGQATTPKSADSPPTRAPTAEQKVILKFRPKTKFVTFRAKPGPFRVTVPGRGSVDAINRSEIHSGVEGTTTLISIVPEGTRVKKGDQVAELDSAALRDQLTNQDEVLIAAERTLQMARQASTPSDIALAEYENGILPQARADLQREVDFASKERAAAGARIVRTRKSVELMKKLLDGKGAAATPSDITALLDLEDRHDRAEMDLQRAEAVRENARARLDILEKYTAPKTIEALKIPVEKARIEERSASDKVTAQRSRRDRLSNQVDGCRLVAPRDGFVVHAEPRDSRGGLTRIEEGATVRERQVICSVVDVDGPMQLIAALGEPKIHLVKGGQNVRVRADPFPNQVLTGVVVEVAPRPDEEEYRRSAQKVYPTRIRLENAGSPLRPGMNAVAEILVTELRGVLCVPIDAVLRFGNKAHLAIRLPDDQIELREVVLGDSNGTEVVVTSGIGQDEQVIREPTSLLPREEMIEKGIPLPQ